MNAPVWNDKAAGMMADYVTEQATEGRASHPLDEALSVLSRRIDTLMKLAEVLRGRLDPVTRPSEPTAPSPSDAMAPDVNRSSPVVGLVREHADRLGSVVTRIERLIGQLDL